VRNLKKFKLLLILFISIALVQSCDKDDDMVKPASVEQETNAEVKEDDNDSGTETATETENDDSTNKVIIWLKK